MTNIRLDNPVNLSSNLILKKKTTFSLKESVIAFWLNINLTDFRKDHFAYRLIGDMIKNKLEDRTNLAQVMEKLLVAIRKNNKLDSYSSNIQLQPIYRLVKNVPLSAAAKFESKLMFP